MSNVNPLTFQFLKTLLIKPFALAFVVTFLSVPTVIRFAKYFDLTDNPKKRSHPAHTHKGTLPRAGGLAIFFGVLIATLLCFSISKQLIGLFTGAVILVVGGLLDDKYNLNPYFRLFIINPLAALAAIGGGIGIPYISNPFDTVISLDTVRISFNFLGDRSILVLADLFAFFWIIWLMNIVGWSGGVAGQLPGFVSITAATIGLVSFRFLILGDLTQGIVVTLAFATAGAYSGFLPFNFPPQKIIPGYSGKSLAGFLLALLSILSQAKVGTAILVLGIPLIDAFYSMLRRIAKGRSPVWADRGHLHHRLLNVGFSTRQIALLYWLVSAILAVIALNLNAAQKFFTLIMLGLILGGIILWLQLYTTSSKPPARANG